MTKAALLASISALASIPTSSPLSAGEITLELRAGGSARKDTPVRWMVPRETALPASWKLVRAEDGREVPAQLDGGPEKAVVWILEEELPAWAKRKYRIEEGVAASPVAVECTDIGGKHLLMKVRGASALRYNQAPVTPPVGVEPVFARSGYIHPVWSPSGNIITNDSPKNHKHHHGIWMPWTKAEFEGRPINFWEQAEGLGKVECIGVDEKASGRVLGGFRTRHRFTDLKAPGGPKPVLDEVWEVKVYAVEKPFIVDFFSDQRCAGASPLRLKEYRYGGFGFRGSEEWEGQDGAEFQTSEGRTRADGHATRARWCDVRGKVGGKDCGIAFLCHPSNFRFPQNMRIHPSEPFFNFTPCQAGDFEIAPGKPFISRYRIVIHDGPLDTKALERLWVDYAEPPEVEVGAGG